MKVFVITNQTLTTNSSYYGVVAVVKTLDNAHAVLSTEEKDFLNDVEQDIIIDFNFSNLNIKEENLKLRIEDKVTGMFIEWNIEECEIK